VPARPVDHDPSRRPLLVGARPDAPVPPTIRPVRGSSGRVGPSGAPRPGARTRPFLTRFVDMAPDNGPGATSTTTTEEPLASTLAELSHPISNGDVGYPGLPAPRVRPHLTHEGSAGRYDDGATFEISRLSMVGNSGTYLDSPAHRFPGRADIAALPLEQLVDLPTLVVPVDADGAQPILFDVTSAMLGAAVLLRTGWNRLPASAVRGQRHGVVARRRPPSAVGRRRSRPSAPGPPGADPSILAGRGGSGELHGSSSLSVGDGVPRGVAFTGRAHHACRGLTAHGLQAVVGSSCPCPGRLGVDAARLVGPHDDLDAVAGVQLAHQGGDVGLDGAEADR
jgi:hypothetical protein